MLEGTEYRFVGLTLAAEPVVGKPRRYRKQIAYAGEFLKRQQGLPDLPFRLAQDTFEHWKRTFDELAAEGVKTYVPVGHTSEAGKSKGTVVDLELAKDDKGRDSAFAHIEFDDEEAEKTYKNSDVSVWVPPSYTVSTSKKTYSWPLRHVALTNNPVLPGMQPFQAIALAFDAATQEMKTMRAIAQKLGIPDTVPDADLPAQILAKIDALMKPPAPPAPGAPAAGPPRPPVAAGFLKMAGDLRRGKLKELNEAGHISTAVVTDLEKMFCTDDALSLALSNDGTTSDTFDGLVASLAKNEFTPGLKGSKTSEQIDPNKGGADNPVLRNAQARADAAKK